jgi:hypothetical protein
MASRLRIVQDLTVQAKMIKLIAEIVSRMIVEEHCKLKLLKPK